MLLRRRGFLGALLGLAAAPTLAKLGFELPHELVVASPALELVERPIVLPTLHGAGIVHEVHIFGVSKTSKASLVRLLRADGTPLMAFNVNAHGGILLWRPEPWCELCYAPESPLVIDSPDDLVTTVVYTGKDGKGIRHLRMECGRRIDLPLYA